MNTFDLCLLRETGFISSGIDSVLWGAANGAVDRGEEALPLPKRETDSLGYWTIYALSFWTVNLLQGSFRQKNNGIEDTLPQNMAPWHITILS